MQSSRRAAFSYRDRKLRYWREDQQRHRLNRKYHCPKPRASAASCSLAGAAQQHLAQAPSSSQPRVPPVVHSAIPRGSHSGPIERPLCRMLAQVRSCLLDAKLPGWLVSSTQECVLCLCGVDLRSRKFHRSIRDALGRSSFSTDDPVSAHAPAVPEIWRLGAFCAWKASGLRQCALRVPRLSRWAWA
jgi:hypothetical protein